jgi:hypothetical protein
MACWRSSRSVIASPHVLNHYHHDILKALSGEDGKDRPRLLRFITDSASSTGVTTRVYWKPERDPNSGSY